MLEFVTKNSGTLIKTIQKQAPTLNYNIILKTLRKKDVKVNDKRVSTDVMLNVGDNIKVYVNIQTKVDVPIVFEDENILVVNKPTGVEVVGNENDLVNLLKSDGKIVFPCHRIDVNTSGLVMFAKNETSEKIVLDAFRNKTIKKFYVAWVCGKLKTKSETLNAHLTKDANNSHVVVTNKKTSDSKPITTIYNVMEELNSTSLILVQIPTGRTHQIRAHFAFIGHPIVGDEKYGDKVFNKKFGAKKQCLSAIRLQFDFGNSALSYLNGKVLEVDYSWKRFLDKDR